MSIKIWVDDDVEYRRPTDEYNQWYLTSAVVIEVLEWYRDQGETIDLMSLDHDLGGDDTTRPIVMWTCMNDYWPTEVRVHTANVVGREWLEGMIAQYKP